MSAHFYVGCMNTSAGNQNNATSRVLGSLKQTCKYLQIVADICDASRHKRSHWNRTKVQKLLLQNIGSVDPAIGGEQRESCVAMDKIKRWGLGVWVLQWRSPPYCFIARPSSKQINFWRSCWVTAAGMRPENSRACLSPSRSASHHEQEGEIRRCSDGGSCRWQSWLPSRAAEPRGWRACISEAFSAIISTPTEADQTVHEYRWSFSLRELSQVQR